MNKAFEKILGFIDEQIKIEESIAKSENEGHPITHQYGANCMNVIKNFVQEVEESNGWIPCSERLPKVPKGIDDAECPEFNVTINGAEESTTLKYSWDGTWFDDSGNLYDVIAWQPMPQLYEEGKQCQE